MRIASFQTVEHFFRVYDHIIKPNDMKSYDFHLFKNNIKPAWEDEQNKDGGKLMIRLKKGLASSYWEELIFALIGEEFDIGTDFINGAVISLRSQEDVLSVWTKQHTDNNGEFLSKLKEQLRKILSLPAFVSIEYKKHTAAAGSAGEKAQGMAAASSAHHPHNPRTNNHPNNSNANTHHHHSTASGVREGGYSSRTEGGGGGRGGGYRAGGGEHPRNTNYSVPLGSNARGGNGNSNGNAPPQAWKSSTHRPLPPPVGAAASSGTASGGYGGMTTSSQPAHSYHHHVSTGDPSRDRDIQEAAEKQQGQTGGGALNAWRPKAEKKHSDADAAPVWTRGTANKTATAPTPTTSGPAPTGAAEE